MIEALRQLPEQHAVTRRYLIGVSGGADSVVLLRLLHELGYRKLVVAHLNHGLRGRASTADATFVRKLAERLDYTTVIARENVAKLAKASKQSIETAARTARYAFFAQVAREHRCPRLFLAHHADDQVESVLMSLFRGAGSSGLGGMREASTQTIGKKRLEIYRPLLGIWRSEILEQASQEKWPFREDASNDDRTFLRNRVRHELIPQLADTFKRDVRTAVARLAEQTSAESDYLDSLVQADAEQTTLSVPNLRRLPLALQRRLLFIWMKGQKVSNVDFDLIERARTLILPDTETAKVNLPKDRHLRRRQKQLFIEE